MRVDRTYIFCIFPNIPPYQRIEATLPCEVLNVFSSVIIEVLLRKGPRLSEVVMFGIIVDLIAKEGARIVGGKLRSANCICFARIFFHGSSPMQP